MWKNTGYVVLEVKHWFLNLWSYKFNEILLSVIGVNNLEGQYNKIAIPNEENVVIYYKIRQQLAKLGKEIEEYVHKPKYCLPFLQPGRLVQVICFFFCIVFISNLYLSVKSAGFVCICQLTILKNYMHRTKQQYWLSLCFFVKYSTRK